MTTIDLTIPQAEALGLLDGLPRRLTLTLPELQLVARQAGGAPLPFTEPSPAVTSSPLDARLGTGRILTEDTAYAAALAALHDPAESLIRRGLLRGGALEPGLVGAVGLLATPRLAVDLDVAVDGMRARAWHRQGGEAVASLATADGVVFELAWFPSSAWAAELSRAAVLPEDLALTTSAVPVRVAAPFALADAALEATRAGRADLLPVLAAQHAGAVAGPDGAPLPDGDVVALLTALAGETRGRLRALVTDAGAPARAVAVVAWSLVADGWRAARALPGEEDLVELVSVGPADLASELAPALAEVAT